MASRAYVFDLDGVLINSEHRSDALVGGPEKYFEKLEEDTPYPAFKSLISDLKVEFYIILLTGRSESVRSRTIQWLERNGIFYHDLFMRPSNYQGSVVDYKVGVLQSLTSSGYHIQAFFEDNPLTVQRAREFLGIPVVEVQSRYYDNVHWDPRENLGWG